MTRILPPFYDYPGARKTRLDSTLALANSDPLLIARGLVKGVSTVHKYGRNGSVPNGTWAGVLQVAAQFPWLTAATTVRIKAGGNAADTGAGAGARTVTVEGLSASGAAASATLTTAGASASASSTQTFSRVFRTYVSTCGTYTGNNTGTITIQNTAGTTDLISIAAGEGQSQFCGYTIPLGKTGYLSSVTIMADGSKAADFRLFTRASYLTTSEPFTPKRLKLFWDGVLGSVIEHRRTPILAMPALTDVWIEARGGGAGTEVSADMEIILVDD